jgi:stress response protein YsnF
MSSYHTHRNNQARATVDAQPEQMVLEGDHNELVDQLYERLRIKPIQFSWDDIFQDQPAEATITVRDPYANEVGYIRGTRSVVHIPFTGDRDLFRMRPTTHNMSPPRAEVKGDEVTIVWEGRAGEIAQAKSYMDQIVGQIQTYAAWSKANVDEFNNQLKRNLAGWLQSRKQHLEQNKALTTALDIRVGRKPNPATDLVPVPVRRPIAVEKPAAKQEQAREPRISDADYAAIIDQLFSARLLIERLPETFAPMGEETLRDILLVILNNQFGPAGGEMFSRKGKTDILIQHERGPVFIAECKIWGGQKRLAGDIEQLLGYLVWRDTKAAVILFVHEKDVTGIVEKAVATLRAHSRFVQDGPNIGDVPTFILHHEGDTRRHIRVALIAIPVIAP